MTEPATAEQVRVLLVDDDEVDRLAVCRLLRGVAGLRVFECEHADDALVRLQAEPFECVVTDYRMPRRDALWLLKAARGKGVDVPFIVLTGQGDEQIAVDLMKAGASDYFGKGKLTTEGLWQSIRRSIRVHRAEREAKLANLALQQSEERLRLALDAAGLGWWDLDPDTREAYWDARAKSMFGLPSDAPIDIDRVAASIHPEDRDFVDAAGWRAMDPQSRAAYDLEFRSIGMSDGIERWLRVTGKALFVNDRAVRFTGTIQDITERKHQEAERAFLTDASAALSSSLDYVQALSRAAAAAVPLMADWCLLDLLQDDGSYKRTFVAHKEGLPSELVAHVERCVPQGADVLPARALAQGKPLLLSEFEERDRGAYAGECLDGGAHLATIGAHSALIVPVMSMGQKLGVLTLLFAAESRRKYVTADFRLGEELARRCALALENALLHHRTEKLLAEVKARADFEQQLIGIVSHDLRNPLNAIVLAAAMLKHRAGDSLDPRALRSIATIESASERATRLVCDLLDFTQARLGGGIHVDRKPLDLRDIARQTVDEAGLAFADRTIELELEGDATGAWDGDRMAQVIGNLVSNALQYSPADSPVRVVLRGEADSVSLLVNNLGEPIPADKLDTLFEPLQRGPGHRGRGIGLGLYIVRQLVNAHHGSIVVTSNEAEGTTFLLTLPRFAPPDERPSPENESSPTCS